MLFENPQIEISELPSTEALDFKKLDPGYLTVKIVNHLVFFTFAGLALILFAWLNDGFPFAAVYLFISGAWVLIYLISLGYMVKAFRYKGYVLRERDIIYRSGWFWSSITIVPFNRIQHCELSQGPFEKIFNLAKLNVFTAGGQSSDLQLPGLKKEEAASIKEFLVNQINDHNNP